MRPPIRFRLKHLLLLCIFLSLLFGPYTFSRSRHLAELTFCLKHELQEPVLGRAGQWPLHQLSRVKAFRRVVEVTITHDSLATLDPCADIGESLKNLTTITFRGVHCDEEVAANLRSCNRLREVYMIDCECTEQFFDVLTVDKKIIYVFCSNTDLSCDTIKSLSRWSDLEELAAHGGTLCKEGIESLVADSRLRTLTLVWTNIENGELDDIRSLNTDLVIRCE